MADDRDRDLETAAKLLPAGLTILGISSSILAGILAVLRDRSISSDMAGGLKTVVWILMPAVVICALQSAVCMGNLAGLIRWPRVGLALSLLLILYLAATVFGWSAKYLLFG